MHLIQFLTVVFVRLFSLLGNRIIAKSRSKRIIIVSLNNHSTSVDYYSIIPLMVSQVIVIYAIFNIASINQDTFQYVILIDKVTHIIRCLAHAQSGCINDRTYDRNGRVARIPLLKHFQFRS